MKRQSPDDIKSLYGHLGLDPDFYKRFSTDAPEVEEQLKRLDEHVSAKPSSKEIENALPAAVISGAAAPPAEPVKDRWSFLSRTEEGRRDRSVPEALAFHSVVGGTGLTTILATASRALSTRGKRVLVADGRPNSTLPMYFGVHSLLRGVNSLILCRGAPIYLLLKEMAEPNLEANDAWLWNAIADLGVEIDRVLLKSWPQMADKTERWMYSSGVSIVVVVPDVRSAVGVKRITHSLQESRARLGSPAPAYFLLNKFDASSSLNVDMRSWLAKELGPAFLPFVIRRDEKVAEALAQGLTVLDYAPDSPAAEDFHRFVEWLPSIPV